MGPSEMWNYSGTVPILSDASVIGILTTRDGGGGFVCDHSVEVRQEYHSLSPLVGSSSKALFLAFGSLPETSQWSHVQCLLHNVPGSSGEEARSLALQVTRHML